jgi:hypothetical protein
MIALLLAGTLVVCAGVLAILFGIPIKEFSFGNTMIICGAIVASTGLILIGLGILAREVRQLSRRLGTGLVREEAELAEIMVAEVPAPAPMVPEPPRPAPSRSPGNSDFLFARDEPAANSAPENEFEFPLPTPAARAPFPPRPERAEPPAATERPKRDFLFSSRRRKDAAQAAADAAAEAETASSTEDNGFEPPWMQQSERPAAPEGDFRNEQRHLLRPQQRFAAAPPRRDQPEITVVKSGVVDSMAYSLYSDGSIEAQMPEGTVRFESIEELRAHLDRRG